MTEEQEREKNFMVGCIELFKELAIKNKRDGIELTETEKVFIRHAHPHIQDYLCLNGPDDLYELLFGGSVH